MSSKINLQTCEYARKSSIFQDNQLILPKYGHYQYLPRCIEIYGECCYFLGRIEESKKAYRQAYYICEAIGDVNLEVTKEEAKKYLNLEFED